MAPKPPTKTSNKNPKARKSATSGPSSSKSKAKPFRPTTQVKTKPASASIKASSKLSNTKKKKQRTYTDKELGLPTLNMITPAGVTKPKGKKKGKIFVDDKEGMMTIMALVNAQKEGQIESKMMRERKLEEIRDARRKEAEKRSEEKRKVLEGKMKEVKSKKTKSSSVGASRDDNGAKAEDKGNSGGSKTRSKKRVSFA